MNIKNNKNKILNNIKLGLNFLILILIMMSSSYAVSQNEILNWNFEEGGGLIMFDSTGNNHNGLIKGMNFDNIIFHTGLNSGYFDGNKDYITGLNTITLNNNFSVSLWVMMDIYSLNDSLIKLDNNNETFEIEYNGLTNQLNLGYYNNLGVYSHQIIDNIPLALNMWEHLIISIDDINDTITYYRNNILILNNSPILGGYYSNPNAKTIKIGTNNLNQKYYTGWMDDIRIFDFKINSSQANDLFLSNSINLSIDNAQNPNLQTPIINTLNLNIINSTSPLINTTTNNNVIYTANLNYKSNCDLYIDNKLRYTFKDIISFSQEVIYNNELPHSYMVYCEYVNGDTLYYDVTEKINFNVAFGSNQVNFILYDEADNLFYGENLYLVTPCLKEYANIFQTKLNQQTPKYFQKINNGQASFNLSFTNQYEFCLVRGQINYKDDSYSTNFDLVEINKQLDLGKLFIKNDTFLYSFRIANTDIKNIYEPGFWNKTWADLFNLIISLIIGGVIIGLGVILKSDKVIMGGVIILIAGMGVSSLSLIGGILL